MSIDERVLSELLVEQIEKVKILESDLRVVSALYADAVKRNVKLTERLEDRAVNLTQNQREILYKAIIKAVDLY